MSEISLLTITHTHLTHRHTCVKNGKGEKILPEKIGFLMNRYKTVTLLSLPRTPSDRTPSDAREGKLNCRRNEHRKT